MLVMMGGLCEMWLFGWKCKEAVSREPTMNITYAGGTM